MQTPLFCSFTYINSKFMFAKLVSAIKLLQSKHIKVGSKRSNQKIVAVNEASIRPHRQPKHDVASKRDGKFGPHVTMI